MNGQSFVGGRAAPLAVKLNMNNELQVIEQLDSAIQNLAQREEELSQYIAELKKRNEEIDEMKSKLYDFMDANGIKKLESEHLTFSMVSPSVVKSLDSKLIESANPSLYNELYAQYGKETPRKGYVRLTNKNSNTGEYLK